MRPIKFRAWNTSMKQMFSAEELATDQMTLLPTGEFINVSGVNVKLSVIYPVDIMIPLQFTGLHDKNGREIYEGDILQTYQDNKVTKYGKPWKVEWISKKHKVGWNIGIPEATSYEVIGNIYENSELLKI